VLVDGFEETEYMGQVISPGSTGESGFTITFECREPPPPPSCTPAGAALECDTDELDGDNAGAGSTDAIDEYGGECGLGGESGPEYAYTFVAAADGEVSVAVDYDDDGGMADLDVFVIEAGEAAECAVDTGVAMGIAAEPPEEFTFEATEGTTYYIPNALTRSSWTAAGYYDTRLTSASTGGFVQGYVYGADTAYWSPLKDILVWASGVTGRTNSLGFYLLNTTSGSVTVTANYSTDNLNYSPDSKSATLDIGEVETIPAFHLAMSGIIKGYVTTGTGALPNVVVKAVRTGASYENYTDPSGYFYIRASTSAFTYTVTPVLATGQAYTS
jgi:hypothetical protein